MMRERSSGSDSSVVNDIVSQILICNFLSGITNGVSTEHAYHFPYKRLMVNTKEKQSPEAPTPNNRKIPIQYIVLGHNIPDNMTGICMSPWYNWPRK